MPATILRHTAFVLASVTLMAHSMLAQPAQRDVMAARVTHGVIAGDVTSNSAVIWSRADHASTMHVLVRGSGRDSHGATFRSTAVTAEHDFTGKVMITGLQPDHDSRNRLVQRLTGNPDLESGSCNGSLSHGAARQRSRIGDLRVRRRCRRPECVP